MRCVTVTNDSSFFFQMAKNRDVSSMRVCGICQSSVDMSGGAHLYTALLSPDEKLTFPLLSLVINLLAFYSTQVSLQYTSIVVCYRSATSQLGPFLSLWREMRSCEIKSNYMFYFYCYFCLLFAFLDPTSEWCRISSLR